MKRLIALLILLGVAVPALAAITVPVNTVVAADKSLYVVDATTSPGISPNIKIYDTSPVTPTLKATIGPSSLGGAPTGVALSKDGSLLYVPIVNTSAVKVYSSAGVYSKSVTGTTFVDPRQAAVAPDGKRLYVVDQAAKAVKVINVSGGNAAYVTSIVPNVSDLYGVAVSPDNTRIAVTRRVGTGAVYIYRIDRDSNGNISGYTLTNTLNTPSGAVMYPSYVAFSANSEFLFVRVDETTSPYRDAIVYQISGGFATSYGINLISASEQDPNNIHGETLSVSSNGQILYLSHYRASDGKIHAYRMSTVNNDGTPRTNWAWNALGNDSEFKTDLLAPKDASFLEPSGSRIWYTCSQGGAYMGTKWTGFTDGSGVLVNPIPAAPGIVHPASPDDLLNYTGSAQWNAPSGDTHTYKRYQADYKEVGTDSWTTLDGFTSNNSTSLAALQQGKTYIFRVRMFGSMNGDGSSGVWGPFAFSDPFRMAQPTITDIQKNSVSVTKGYIYDGISIIGTGFGTRAIPADPVDDSNYNIKFSTEIIPQTEGSNARITSWTNTKIDMVIPRKFKSGTLVTPKNNYSVSVTAFGIASNSRTFEVGPVITTMTPTTGVIGTTVDIYGAGFGATQGTSAITFYNGQTATATIWSSDTDSDHIRCTVPTGAVDGAVKVTVNSEDTYVNYAGTANPVTFDVTTAGVPTITKLQYDANPDPVLTNWVDTTEAIVYDSIKIVGSGFGLDPGDGNRDTPTNNVKLAGNTIRDDSGSTGLQVYSWSDTAIEFGVPRRVGATFINAGANAIIVTANSVASNSTNLNIRPHIYGISPNSGNPGVTATVDGTALEGARTIYFDSTSAGSGTINRQMGDDPDGTNGNDQVTITVPLALTAGSKLVSANVNAFTSNNDVTFNVIPAGDPTITQIIPNAAPNTADITVVIKGTNFQSGATVVLKKAAQPDITGVVTFDSATKLTVKLPINGKVVGKWDVLLTNPDTHFVNKAKGFTITDPSDETALIIDDYEGIAVIYPNGYSKFPSPADLDLQMSAAEKYEGDLSGAATYVLSANGYRGYNGTLTTMQDISNFTTLTIRVKSADASGGKIKLQMTDVTGKNFAAVDGLGNQLVNIPTSNVAWTKYTINLSSFVEIDSNGLPKVSGAAMNKQGITNYQLIYTGNASSTATVYVDMVAAGGYTPPSGTSEITTSITRAGETVGSAVSISWVYNDSYVGNADIYTISGSWDAAAGIFTTDATKWTKSYPNVTSPQNDATQVGQGTQKYYKVVKTGIPLTNAMLAVDVAGKFDIAVGPSDTAPERALISLPLVTSGTGISTVFGSQPAENDAIAVVDNNFAIISGKVYTTGSWQDIFGFTPLNDLNQGYAYIYTALVNKYMTVVGKVAETSNTRTITGGWDIPNDTAKLSWIGSALPIPAPIADTKTGLNGLSFGDSAITGAQAAQIDANASIIGNDYALHNAASTWVDTNLLPATMVLMPGRGYMLTEPTIVSYSWTQSR